VPGPARPAGRRRAATGGRDAPGRGDGGRCENRGSKPIQRGNGAYQAPARRANRRRMATRDLDASGRGDGARCDNHGNNSMQSLPTGYDPVVRTVRTGRRPDRRAGALLRWVLWARLVRAMAADATIATTTLGSSARGHASCNVRTARARGPARPAGRRRAAAGGRDVPGRVDGGAGALVESKIATAMPCRACQRATTRWWERCVPGIGTAGGQAPCRMERSDGAWPTRRRRSRRSRQQCHATCVDSAKRRPACSALSAASALGLAARKPPAPAGLGCVARRACQNACTVATPTPPHPNPLPQAGERENRAVAPGRAGAGPCLWPPAARGYRPRDDTDRIARAL